ncbi:MAG: GvpL/GvpF family gas vesicle protein [Candidatus Riflebacteria bacterium]|nr:GvpL/GvpF family gas vesicle protein [Candidatus Riflebacteria bacterium]
MTDGKRKLIFCVIEAGEAVPAGRVRIEETELAVIPFGRLGAVVTDIGAGGLDGCPDDRIREYMALHQRVNLALMSDRTVVPFRFGSVARDAAEIRVTLSRVYIQLEAALMKLRDSFEVVLQAHWDLASALQEIKRCTHFQAALAALGREFKGQAFVEKAGQMLFEAAEAKRNSLARALTSKLAPLAAAWTQSPLKGDSMIFNRSYLVEKENETLFDDAVNELAECHGTALKLRYIGPLPPSSFADIEFSRGNFEVVDQALRTLALPSRVSLARIKASYRKLSLECHPDRCLGNAEEHESRFKLVAAAYGILTAYCRAARGAEPASEAREYSFDRDAVESMFMAKQTTPSLGHAVWN